MTARQKQVLKLYKDMLREAQKFPNYYFRNYALRKIKHGFNMGKTLTDCKEIQNKHDLALKTYEMLKRQVIVSTLYKTDDIVVVKNTEKLIK